MSNQGAKQAAIRASTGTALTYEGDWHALFDQAGIASGNFDGRLLTWINNSLATSYTDLPQAQQALATSQGFFNWDSMNTVPVAWSPGALGGSLLGWWDAERTDLITQTSGSVSSWRDVVAGYDMAQTTGSLKPVWSATSYNNRPGITFDGVDDYLGMSAIPFPSGATACEIWVLVDQTAAAGDATIRCAFSYGATGTDSRRLRRVVNTLNRADVGAGNGVTFVAAENDNVDFSGRHVVRGVIDGANANATVDGITMSNVAVVPTTTNTGATRIGASPLASPSQYWQGAFNSVLVTSILSGAQASQLTTYLKARGGIA